MPNYFIKSLIPESLKKRYRVYNAEKLKLKISQLHKFSESEFSSLIEKDLFVKKDDVVFVHSSIDHLNLDFPFYKIIPMLLNIVGENGTILFPTYPLQTSFKFLEKGEVFDVQRTPTYTGLLNEFARRYKGAVRSLHPTKSVVAIGKYATEIVSTHHLSPFPYDYTSPYFKISEFDGRIIGLGVKTTYLSAVHVIDDTLKKSFPVEPYHKKLFEAKCINYDRKEVIVKTYAHDMKKMGFILPDYFKKYMPDEICLDKEIHNMNFFTADSKKLFAKMTELVLKDNITIYDKKFYKH